MARKITFGKLMSSLCRDLPRLQSHEEAADLTIAIINKVWEVQDFRETLDVLPPFYLIGGVQDYGPPFYTVPNDFLGLRQASVRTLTDSGTSVGVSEGKPLKIVTRQQPLIQYNAPEIISYEPSINSFRLFPFLSTGAGCNTWLIEGVYKKLPQSNILDENNIYGTPILADDITRSNYHRVLLPIDDRHYDILRDITGLMAKKAVMGLSNDTAQLEQYIDAKLHKIAELEGLNIGSGLISPAEPLMASNSYPMFLF